MLPKFPYICLPFRTPIGKFGGKLRFVRADDLMAHVIRGIVQKASISPFDIDEVLVGCANQAGEDNRNIARMSTLLAGLDVSTPGITLNRLCASGLDAVIAAARRIALKECSITFAGGVENMTRAPLVMEKASKPFTTGVPKIFDTALGWRFFNPEMATITPPEPNGLTVEHLAQEMDISRSHQDQFALNSHQRAVEATQKGYFANEILPILACKNDNEPVYIDECPRENTSIDALSKLKPAFKAKGTVTAGNSSSLNDGAAGMIICSKEKAEELGLAPVAKILGFATSAIHPRKMGLGPLDSILTLLKKLHLKMEDFDLIEINEAFAAQTIAVARQLKIPEEKLNVFGGAIALGHPLGCSGARIVCTLINALQVKKKKLGLASLCVGVGQGVSLAVEAV